MNRLAADRRVFFVEEPFFDADKPFMEMTPKSKNLVVCRPHLADGTGSAEAMQIISGQISDMAREYQCKRHIAWFYTPMMFEMAADLDPAVTVFDCMDELSAFKNAPAELIDRERRLMEKADVVFTGGQSLFEAKRSRHANVHAFPSSVDVKHFNRALEISDDVPDQVVIPRPRIGYAGVIDERLDIELLAAIADIRSDWHFVMLGPVVKISEDDLPRRPNIHYLGMKAYGDLPAYLAGWDVAMMPFARNESTKYISPTKTPEYLSAGLPVVSTAITDVVRPYGENGLVRIAATPDEFVAAITHALEEDREDRLSRVNEFLREISWDKTFAEMSSLIREVIARRASQTILVGG
jgi:UDP-galactopyranose mutase